MGAAVAGFVVVEVSLIRANLFAQNIWLKITARTIYNDKFILIIQTNDNVVCKFTVQATIIATCR